MKPHRLLTLVTILLLAVISTMSKAQDMAQLMSAQPGYAFIENKGQVTDQNGKPNAGVKFILPLPGNNVVLKATGFSYDTYITEEKVLQPSLITGNGGDSRDTLRKDITYKYHRVDVTFEDADPLAEVITEGKSEDHSTYYVGAQGNEVRVHHYKKITYKNIYPGIDVEFLAQPGTHKPLEYNFIVQPGADMDQIRLRYRGANTSKLIDGKLELALAHGQLTETIPASYWQKSKENEDIRYKQIATKSGEITLGFSHASGKGISSRQEALIIDPVPYLAWGTYYGSSGTICRGIATDNQGNVLVTGNTYSAELIATDGAQQTALAGDWDAFVAKFNAEGERQWATFYGGAGYDAGVSVAADGSRNVYVTGKTNSTFGIAAGPVVQPNYGGGDFDAFVVKYSAAGVRQWATYLGAAGSDESGSIAVTNFGDVFVCGQTTSTGLFAGSGGHQSAHGGGSSDAFVAKLDSEGSGVWGTYYGGTGSDGATGVAIHSGNILVTGSTSSADGIATAGKQAFSGQVDAFVVKFNGNGVRQWGTYFGGEASDEANSIAVHPSSGDFCIAGRTNSTSNMTSYDAYQKFFQGWDDAFVAKFTTNGERIWGTYYGVQYRVQAIGVAIDAAGNVYVAGHQTSNVNLVTFVVKFNTNGAHQWNFYHGGTPDEYPLYSWPYGLAVDPVSSAIYLTTAGSLPTIVTPGADQTESARAFIAKYLPCNGDATGTTVTCDICAPEAGQRCAGAGTTQFTSTTSNGRVEWYISDNDPLTTNTISPTTGLVTWDPAFSGQATVTLMVKGCGPTVTRTQTITVIPPLAATELTCDFCQGSEPTRCQALLEENTQFNSTITGASSAVWEITDINPEVSNSIDQNGLVTWNPAFSGKATIRLTVTGSCGTFPQLQKTVDVEPRVSASVPTCDICAGDTPSRCQGEGTTQFNATIANAGTVEWTISDDNPELSNTISATGEVTWDPAFFGQATITLTVTGCATITHTKTITVIPPVTATPLACDICGEGDPSRCASEGATQFTSDINNASAVVWTITDDNPEVSNTISPEGLVTWNASFDGQAIITLTAEGCGGPITQTKTVIVKGMHYVPALTLHGPSFVCPGGEAEFNITIANGPPSPQVEFLINDELLSSGTNTSFLIPEWNYENGASVRCRLPNPNECETAQGPESKLITVYTQLEGIVTVLPADGMRCKGPGTTQFSASAYVTDYTWSIEYADAGSSISPSGLVTWNANETGLPSITIAAQDCPSAKTSSYFYIQEPPEVPANQTVTGCNWETITLKAHSEDNFINWYDHINTLVHTGDVFDAGTFPVVATYTYFIEAVTPQGCKSESKGTVQLQITSVCDDNKLNWIEKKSLDESTTIYSHSKQYFDFTGKALQQQTKLFSDESGVKILATQGLRDKFSREVGTTLPAPMQFSDFQYHYGFVLNGSSAPYSFTDFDGLKLNHPDPVNNSVPGTLGWYYSSNNTMEDHVPETGYPYSRTDFYEDGMGEVKRSASPGDIHRLGMGHEVLSGTFPVFSELDDYLDKRVLAIPGIVQDGSLANEGVQSVVRDQNGKYAVSISDKAGKSIMTCRAGTVSDYVLTVTNAITSSGNPASAHYRRMTYFYILHDQPVTISGASDFVAENIVTNERKPAGVTFANTQGKWPAGFYRILLNNPASQITISYTNYFLDVSYQFYDDAARLVASVSPNGYKAWIAGTDYAFIDKTTYAYNHQGFLLKTNEPDAGTTYFIYRKDGKIRFSQNALQRADNRFTYTHYDRSGRPVESGEYIGSALTFVAMNDPAYPAAAIRAEVEKTSDQVVWGNALKKDWTTTHYDYAASIPHLPSGYTQEFVRGAVSWTENANTKTWYSYDELGRVKWMAQAPLGMNRTFLTKYSHDFLGNVITVSNISFVNGTATSAFYHHYTYDNDRRLKQAHTSTDGTNVKLRATYEYYLHGPLKRIALGDGIQGIDFVYNIQGWLTQINHPDNAQDPGHDGTDNGFHPDVFGMSLDYYESEMTGLFPVSVNPANMNAPGSFHHLPVQPASSGGRSFNRQSVIGQQQQPFGAPEQFRHNRPDSSLTIRN